MENQEWKGKVGEDTKIELLETRGEGGIKEGESGVMLDGWGIKM